MSILRATAEAAQPVTAWPFRGGIFRAAAGRLVQKLAVAAIFGLLLHDDALAVIEAERNRNERSYAGKPVIEMPHAWSSLMRIDLLAVALSFAGVYLAILGTRRPWLLHAAALAFVLAIYTRQTMLAAPAAAFGVLWLREPKQVRAPIASGLAIAIAALAWLIWQTDGGLIRHIFVYVISPYSTLLLAVVTAYFILSRGMLITVGKSGAGLNYFVASMCVWSVIIGTAFRRLLSSPLAQPGLQSRARLAARSSCPPC